MNCITSGTFQSLAERLLKSVALFPNRMALELNTGSLTYSDMDLRSQNIVSAVQSVFGVETSNRKIGIFCEKSEWAYVGIWAALKLQMPFVPLNKKIPELRLVEIISQAEIDVLLVDESNAKALESLLPQLKKRPLIIFPENSKFEFSISVPAQIMDRANLSRKKEQFHLSDSVTKVDMDQVVYILFTSGSTGTPKGVPIKQKNLIHFLSANQKRYQINCEDKLSQTFDLTFDLSMFDVFMAWTNGACVSVFSAQDLLSPQDVVNQRQITVWFSVPSVLLLLMKQETPKFVSMPNLRLSLFCGEPLTFKAAQFWRDQAPQALLENLYGPTELTISCAAFRCDDEYFNSSPKQDHVPLGQLTEGLEYVLYNEGQPEGVGELCVRGPQRFDGYLNFDEERLSQYFLPAQQFGKQGAAFYRTGDIVRESEIGLVFIGRKDRQVKILGYRIELGDIESALRDVPGVVFAAVLVLLNPRTGQKEICAFLFGSDLESTKVKRYLEQRIPSYMIPQLIQVLEHLPTNNNGKVDYKKLESSVVAACL